MDYCMMLPAFSNQKVILVLDSAKTWHKHLYDNWHSYALTNTYKRILLRKLVPLAKHMSTKNKILMIFTYLYL